MDREDKDLSGMVIALVVIVSSLSVSLANLTGSLKILDVGGKPHDVSLAVMTYNVLYTLMSLSWTWIFYGRFNRRGTLLISLSGLFVGLFAMYVSESVQELILSSGLIGLFSAVLSPLLTTMLTDYIGRDSIAVTKYNVYSSMGLIIGYFVAGSLRSFTGLGGVLLMSLAFLLISIPASLLISPKYVAVEPRKVSYLSSIPQFTGRLRPLPSTLFTPKIIYNMGRLARDFRKMVSRRLGRRLPLALLATGVFFTGVSAFFSLLPPMLRYMGVSDSVLYYSYLYSTIVTIISYAFIIKRRERMGSPWRALIYTMFSRVGIFLLPLAPLTHLHTSSVVAVSLLLLFTLVGITWGIITVYLPVAILSISEAERKDERLGHMNASIGAGMIMGSALSGLIVRSTGYVGVAVFASLASLSSALIFRKAEEAIVN